MSRDSPYYKTSALSGAMAGVGGASAVCTFAFSLPISIPTILIGGAAGLATGLVVEYLSPSKSYAASMLKAGVAGLVAGASAYYVIVRLAPNAVLSAKQLSVIQERALKIAGNPDTLPTNLTWDKTSPAHYFETYQIKDQQTGHVVDLIQKKNAIRIDMKYNPVTSADINGLPVGKGLDFNHVFLELSGGDGRQKANTGTFIAELGAVPGAYGESGGCFAGGCREGTVLKTFYVDPNKSRTLDQVREMILPIKKFYDDELLYDPNGATCQHYAQDIVHVLSGLPINKIPLKEKNTFRYVKFVDQFFTGTFPNPGFGCSQATRAVLKNSKRTMDAKSQVLKLVKGFPPQFAEIIPVLGVVDRLRHCGMAVLEIIQTVLNKQLTGINVGTAIAIVLSVLQISASMYDLKSKYKQDKY